MSGLYTALFGVHPAAGTLLKILNLTPEDTGRFRDCFPSPDGSRIIVHTRNGGGNRDDYEEVFKTLSRHPRYIKDYDEECDNTYASIEFSVPLEHAHVVKAIAHAYDCTPPAEKWKKAFADLESGRETDITKRAAQVAKGIADAMEKGGGVVDGGNIVVSEIDFTHRKAGVPQEE